MGRYLPAFVAGLALLATPAWAVPLTFTVDSTGDGDDAGINGTCAVAGGGCTVRAAIQEANANAGADTIAFAIPPLDGTVKTITPVFSQLPTIADPVVIDGYTQDDAHPNTLALGGDALLRIELNGAATANAATGIIIVLGGSGSTGRQVGEPGAAQGSERRGFHRARAGDDSASR